MARNFIPASFQWINLGDDTNLLPAHGMSCWCWINTDSVTGNKGLIRYGRGGVSGWAFFTSGDELQFVKNAVLAITITSINLSTGVWLFVAAVETSSNVIFYKITADGTVISNTISNTSSFTGTPTEGLIGVDMDSVGSKLNYYDGRMSYAGAVIQELTLAQLKTIMWSHNTSLGDVGGSWEIQGNEDPEDDWAKANFTGALVNNPLKDTSNPPVEHMENYL